MALLENPNTFLYIHATVSRHKAEKLFSFKITLAVLVLSCSWACLPCSDFVSCPQLCRRRYCHKLFPDICRSMLEAPSAVHSGEKLLCSQVVTEGGKSATLFFSLLQDSFMQKTVIASSLIALPLNQDC